MFKQKLLKGSFCAALAGLSMASSVFAADFPAITFGADYGRTEAKKYCEHITNCEDSDNGPKVEIGYDFNENFGMELGYTSFGTLFDSNSSGVKVSQKSNAVSLSVLGTIPVGDWFGVYGRLGYARYDTNNSGSIEGVPIKDEHGNSPFWGGGVKFNVNEQLALRLEYQNYSNLSDLPGHKDDVQGLFAGGVYRF